MHPGPAHDPQARLAQAVALRTDGRAEEARAALLDLGAAHPEDPAIAYQTAWTHDVLGREAEALPYYERALATPGLDAADRAGAQLGLGSTYRILGRYEDAVRTLRTALTEHPGDGALRTFLAMALYNTGAHHEAMRLLLHLLAETSEDPQIGAYRKAVAHYADDLDAVE